jgi:hypothetical protein
VSFRTTRAIQRNPVSKKKKKTKQTKNKNKNKKNQNKTNKQTKNPKQQTVFQHHLILKNNFQKLRREQIGKPK